MGELTGKRLCTGATFMGCSMVFSSVPLAERSTVTVPDAGVKSFAMDQDPPYLTAWPGAQIKFSEEHTAAYGIANPPAPGTLVRCVPGHCCTTIARHREIYLVDGDEVDRVLRITG